MGFEDIPKEKLDQLTMLGYSAEIEVEDDKRRQCTRLGYRLGGTLGMVICIFLMLVTSAVYMIALPSMAPDLGRSTSSSPLFWLGFMPAATVPFVPFVFLKLPYAVRAFMVIIAFLLVGLMVVTGLHWAVGKALL